MNRGAMSEPVLELKGVSKTYNKGKPNAVEVLADVDLSVKPGELVALVAPSGAGKSTLLHIAGLLDVADGGEVRIGGRGMTGLSDRRRTGVRRQEVGFVYQFHHLLPEFTALENTMLAVLGAGGGVFRFLRPALHDPALTDPARFHLDQAGLAGRAAVPAGVLSHGERRRLEIAMALAMRPRAFLLDEPMAGMGAEGARDLTAILSDLRAEAPILLVEHDMDAVFALADRISVLVYGRIIATGSVEEIRANAEVRRSYLGEEA